MPNRPNLPARLMFEGHGRPQFFAFNLGDYRPPLAGEFYVSGACPQAYKMPRDSSACYWIVTPRGPGSPGPEPTAEGLADALADLIREYIDNSRGNPWGPETALGRACDILTGNPYGEPPRPRGLATRNPRV